MTRPASATELALRLHMDEMDAPPHMTNYEHGLLVVRDHQKIMLYLMRSAERCVNSLLRSAHAMQSQTNEP